MSLFLKTFIDILARETGNAARRFGMRNLFEKETLDEEKKTSWENDKRGEDGADETEEEQAAKEFKLKNLEKTHIEEEIEFHKEQMEKPLESIERETRMVKERIRYEMRSGVPAERDHAFEPP